MEVTLTYRRGGITYSKAFVANALRGLTEPDTLRKVWRYHPLLNGGLREQIRGFNKVIGVELRAITNHVEREFLVDWFVNDESRRLIYGLYDSKVVPVGDSEELVANWLYDCEHNRQFSLNLISTRVYTTWTDPVPVEEDELDFKNNVEIDDTKTIDDPLVLITNGNLPLREDGSAWPEYDSTTYDYLVLVQCSNGAVAVFPESHEVNVDGDMEITLFPGSGFILAQDGKLYANIAIYQKAKSI